MFESLGIGYVIFATTVFTVETLALAIFGLLALDKVIRRGIAEARRDIQMGLASSADLAREEVRAAMRGDGR